MKIIYNPSTGIGLLFISISFSESNPIHESKYITQYWSAVDGTIYIATCLEQGRKGACMPEHMEEIVTGGHRYQVHMGGTMDGVNTRDPVGYAYYEQVWEPNIFVSMENIGDTAIINPLIVVNGKRNWRSIDHMLDEVLEEGMTEAEKARAIWEFARAHRYHTTTGDDEVKDTVKMLNVYGYTLCWDEAYTVSNLWQAAGLKIRRGIPHGHCTTEVFFNGQYHLMDSDEHLLYLLRDNETIAGEEELAHDHDLVKRGHAYGILQAENRETNERTAGLFVYDGPRTGSRPLVGNHRMDLTLRPGETLLWEWEDRGKYHGFNLRPPRLYNGRLQYIPPMTFDDHQWCEQIYNLTMNKGGIHPIDPMQEGGVSYRVSSPYVMVGGKMIISGSKSDIELSFDGDIWARVGTVKDHGPTIISLDGQLPPDGSPRYEYWIRFRGVGMVLQRLFIETDLQMAPLSLPALETGDNTIAYTDETPGVRQVQVTHGWYEKSDAEPPPAPSAPVHPTDGGEEIGTAGVLSWHPSPDATDYHIQLSARSDMKYVLSPVFDKLISKTPSAGLTEWRIPNEGLLNPGETYYWHVRSRNNAGMWGGWSETWYFVPQAPGLPHHLRLEIDEVNQLGLLCWESPETGTPVHHYEIYGSNERGFSVSRNTHLICMGSQDGMKKVPGNLLGETDQTELTVVDANLSDTEANHCYYRVVAVDVNGAHSGPSDYIDMPRPFIYSHPPATAVVGERTSYTLRVIRSDGDLRAVSEGPQRYVTAFRDGDALRFILDEGPPWLELHDTNGIFIAKPDIKHIGLHTITIRVQNGQGGMAVQGFDLEVVA